MFCTECGAAFVGDAKFCGKCGAKTIQTDVSAADGAKTVAPTSPADALTGTKKRPRNTLVHWIIRNKIGIGIFIIGYFIVVICINTLNSSERLVHRAQSLAPQPPSARPNRNVLETAISVESGTHPLWNAFVDEGGLNRENSLYGLKITNISASWDRNTEKFTSVFMQARAVSTSPKEVRDALSKVCGLQDTNWTYSNKYESTGTGKKASLTCYYIFGDAKVDISILTK